MDDDTDTEKDDTKRISRNLNEKKRRDQFNLLVNELSSLVSLSNRKMDKATVLRSTISFLRQYNEITIRSRVHEIQENWKPSCLSNEEYTHLTLEALEGFIIVISSDGQIHHVSESVTSLLGHLPSDLLNMTIYDLAFDGDHNEIYNVLSNPSVIVNAFSTSISKENQVTFICHLKRGEIDSNQDTQFELVQFIGYFRHDNDVDHQFTSSRDSSRLLFVGMCKIQTPQLIRELSVIDSSNKQFASHHSLQWKFLFLDDRATSIIGYLPFEVLGTSGYDYYHSDDLDKVVKSHKALMQKGQGTSCFYRFLTKGQQWIWLQSNFYIRYHQWNSKPEIVICTHRILNYADVINEIRKNIQNNNDHLSVGNSNTGNTNAIGKTNKIQETSTGSNTIEKQLSAVVTTIDSSPYSPINFLMSKFGSSTAPGSPNLQTKHQNQSYDGSVSDPSSFAPSKYAQMRNYKPRTKRQHQGQILKPNTSHTLIQRSPLVQHHSDSQQFIQSFQPITLAPTPHLHHTSFQDNQQFFPMAPQIIGSTFNEVSSQCLTATQIQSAVVLAQPTSSLSYTDIVMTSTQTHIQDELQRKHEELQQLIAQQQDELRRVSEQLLMARYGLIPTLPPSSNAALLNTVEQNIESQSLPKLNVNQQLNSAMDTDSPTHPCDSSGRQISNADMCAPSDDVVSYIDLKPSASSTVGLEYSILDYQQHQQSQDSASEHHSIQSMSHIQHQHLSSGTSMQDQPLPQLSVYNQQLNNTMDSCSSTPCHSSSRQIVGLEYAMDDYQQHQQETASDQCSVHSMSHMQQQHLPSGTMDLDEVQSVLGLVSDGSNLMSYQMVDEKTHVLYTPTSNYNL